MKLPATVADGLMGPVDLVQDHQAVDLAPDEAGILHRVIACCDCGLVHFMRVDPHTKRAYFVREDGPAGEDIRRRAREAGHVFPREGGGGR